MTGRQRIAIALGLGGLVAGFGWRRGALSGDGSIAAAAVGTATFGFGGLPASLGLIAFFASGSALSRRSSTNQPRSSSNRRSGMRSRPSITC